MHGEEEKVIPGHALSIDKDKPFRAVADFGSGFMSRFEGCECAAPLLEQVSLLPPAPTHGADEVPVDFPLISP